MRTKPKTPRITPEEIETRIEGRRTALAADLHELSSRLAPRRLYAQARQMADAAVQDLRTRAKARAADLKERACPCRRRTTAEEGSGDSARACPLDDCRVVVVELSPAALKRRTDRLLDDARDGDPASLAAVTGAAVALSGVSLVALVKAVRR